MQSDRRRTSRRKEVTMCFIPWHSSQKRKGKAPSLSSLQTGGKKEKRKSCLLLKKIKAPKALLSKAYFLESKEQF